MTPKIQEALIIWFQNHQRSMPWRDDPSPYKVWISEIMLQQTTVSAVIPYFLRFIKNFPNLSLLSKAEEVQILTLWAGLGYYSRAKNILKTAQILKEEKNIPKDFHVLQKLPGIGPYTAGAICSIAFHQPVSLIDTNVDRVLGRFFALERKQEDFKKTLKDKAQILIEQIDVHDIWIWNQALMELGALVCRIQSPLCEECPLRSSCLAYDTGSPESFPGEKPKRPVEEITEYALVMIEEDKYYLSQITTGKRRKGLYDFPISDNPIGQEIKRESYRISYHKVERVYCLIDHYEGEGIWIKGEDALKSLPLVSPCKKFLNKTFEQNSLNKEQ